MLFTFVFAAIATITCSATQRSSWPTSSDVHRSSLQVSKFPASKFPVTKFPATSCTMNVGPVGSWSSL